MKCPFPAGLPAAWIFHCISAMLHRFGNWETVLRREWDLKKSIMKDRTFLLMALVLWCCLIVLASAVMGYFLNRRQMENRKATEKEQQTAITDVRNYVENMIQQEYLISDSLKDTYWLVKMSSNTDVFDDWLTPMRLKEISKDFLFYINKNTDVYSRVIYFPKKGYVLHTSGYNKADYYFRSNGFPGDSVQEYLEYLGSITDSAHIVYDKAAGIDLPEDQIVLLNPIQRNQSPDAYLYSTLKTSVIEKRIQQILPTYFTGMDLLARDGQTQILSLRRGSWQANHDILTEESVSLLGWEIQFYIDESAYPTEIIDPVRLVASTLLIIMASGGISLVLVLTCYRPLKRILRFVPENWRTGDTVKDISNSMSHFHRTVAETSREISMRRLLLGDQNVDFSCMSYLEKNPDMYVLSILIPDVDVTADDFWLTSLMMSTFRDTQSWNVEVLTYYDNSMVLCFFADRKEILEELKAKICQASCITYAGSIEQGSHGAAVSFKEARTRQRYAQMTGKPRFYLPIDLESRLCTLLQEGDSKKTRAVLKILHEKNEQLLENGEMFENDVFQLGTILMNDFVRVLSEHSNTRGLLDVFETMDYSSLDSIFSILTTIAVEQGVHLSAGASPENAVALEIVGYINDHLAQCDLSIITLQNAFNMSSNTINKNIRAITGETFMPYLTRIRMEKAKELLSVRGAKVADVYQRVGYEQEYSFRRAFARYNGYKAQDHITSGTAERN